RFPHLRTIRVDPGTPRRFPGKKDALAIGLAAARYEQVLVTDADCYPRSPHWIETMASYAQSHEVVCGPGLYDREPGLLNRIIQGETMHSYLQAFCYADMGWPYMGLGRNLLTRKSRLESVQDHPLWSKTPSGDDDLFIRLQPLDTQMVYLFDPQAQTLSRAKKHGRDWIAQKQRHVSTGKYYRW